MQFRIKAIIKFCCRLNESDARSTISKVSATTSSSLSSNAGRSCSSPPQGSEAHAPGRLPIASHPGTSRQGSSCPAAAVATATSTSRSVAQEEDEDAENIDLWTVWGNLIKSWECEMKRRPSCVKVYFRFDSLINYLSLIHNF